MASDISRRRFLRNSAVAGLSLGTGGALTACGGDDNETTTAAASTETSEAGASTTAAGAETTAAGTETTAAASSTAAAGAIGREVTIGYVSPQTGPLAPFGEADGFVLDGLADVFGAGITIAGATHPVRVIVQDSESDPNRAAEGASDLILSEGVDLMVVASTPETTNPVSDACEANGVPCISTVAPWQPWFFGRGGDPAAPFMWTYHFFWGLEDIIAVFLDIWGQIETNKMVGALWPNDGDGNAWGDPELGFPPPLTEAGYTIVDPGRYGGGTPTDDFSSQIAQFRDAGVEIVTGVPIPPDWTTFYTQAAQSGLTPKIATIGKAILFPASVEALGGDLGNGLTSEVWWTPSHPTASSLTGATSAELGEAYEASGRQWTQPLGFVHALFEVAADVLSRTEDVDDKASILAAIPATSLDTIVGTVDWSSGPVPNVAKTKLVGGQWVTGAEHPYDLVVVTNTGFPEVPVEAEVFAIEA